RVLGDLAALGFDAEWHCIPASAVGAPHRRDRLWIVAYAGREHGNGRTCQQDGTYRRSTERDETGNYVERCGQVVAHATRDVRSEQEAGGAERERAGQGGQSIAVADADIKPILRPPITRPERDPWLSEPDVGRVAHGVPARVDR